MDSGSFGSRFILLPEPPHGKGQESDASTACGSACLHFSPWVAWPLHLPRHWHAIYAAKTDPLRKGRFTAFVKMQRKSTTARSPFLDFICAMSHALHSALKHMAGSSCVAASMRTSGSSVTSKSRWRRTKSVNLTGESTTAVYRTLVAFTIDL